MVRPTLQEKRDRARQCNELLRVIGSCGRRFFYQPKSTPNHPGIPPITDSWAYLEIGRKGHVFYIDDWTRRRIYTHYPHEWRYFNHGGTLRNLIIAMREYICGDRPSLKGHLGPWPEWVCQGDLWGYGEEMQLVRDAAIALGLYV